MAKKDYHVKMEGDAWVVIGEGNKKPTSKHDTQKDAWEAAKGRAEKGKAKAVKYGKDGKIKEQRSYE